MEQALTPQELAEIERRATEATPGPWEAGVRYERFGVNPGLRPGEGPYSFLPAGRCYVCAESGAAPVCTERDRFGTLYHVHRMEMELSRSGTGWRAISSAGTRELVVESYEGMLSTGLRSSDAAFIAHARQDVPRLVAEVRRLRMALEELRRSLREEIQRPLAEHPGGVAGVAGPYDAEEAPPIVIHVTTATADDGG
ncbi:MAG TPA: hypothetical protein VHG28_14945 [Longimicrobiaceae bacterium]|nr:hypothetical protein [Longimicrobiaceae bacterium]